MTTYATDADVLQEYPDAVPLLADSDLGSFLRPRGLVYRDINLALKRRSPSIDAPGDLDDLSELIRCEVFGVLAHLFRQCASKPGYSGNDWYTQQADYYRARYDAELASPLSVDGDYPHVGAIRIRRA